MLVFHHFSGRFWDNLGQRREGKGKGRVKDCRKRSERTRKPKWRWRKALPAGGWTTLRREHRIRTCLALGRVRRRDGVDDRLCFLVADFWRTDVSSHF